jgi:dCMP deaminase
MDKWDNRFMELAEHISYWSKDPRTKVGSVIVDDRNRVVSMGYNGFPRGVHDTDERYEHRPLKHLLVSHAERNALDNSPLTVEGCTLYCTL